MVVVGFTGARPVRAEADPRRDAAVGAVERVLPSVVNIGTKTVVERRGFFEDMLREFYGPYYRRRAPDTQYSLGSGVIIDEDGYVLTNWHVVQMADQVWVRLGDGRIVEAEWMVGTSQSDVALLKLKSQPGDRFPAARFAADDDLLLGETVLALGNPFGLGGSVSRGILSSKNRRPPAADAPLEMADWLQTDAAMNPGNSGGPLIDLRGEIVGLNVAVFREGQGIGFAIPIKRVSEAIAEIFSPETLKELWFGAKFLNGTNCFMVHAVQAGSPAEKGGLRAGDAVLRVNGKAMRNVIELTREVVGAGDPREVGVLIQRGAERRNLTVRLVAEKTVFNAAMVRQKLGLTLQPVTPALAESLQLPSAEGLVVADVEAQSPAAAAGLQTGFLIRTCEGLAASDVRRVAKIVYDKKKGQKVNLEVLSQRRRGGFIEYRSGAVEVAVR
jgi:serine protease Do